MRAVIGALRAGRTHPFDLVVISRVRLSGEIEDFRRISAKLRAAVEHEWSEMRHSGVLRRQISGRRRLEDPRTRGQRVRQVWSRRAVIRAEREHRVCCGLTSRDAVVDAGGVRRRAGGQGSDPRIVEGLECPLLTRHRA